MWKVARSLPDTLDGMFHRRGLMVFLLVPLFAGAGGCTAPETFDRNAPVVSASRQTAAVEVADVVRTAVRGLPLYGSADLDACEQGRDDAWSQDDYRWRCVAGYLAVAGVRGKAAAAAVSFAEEHLTSVGCVGSLRADAQGLAGLDRSDDLSDGPERTYRCAQGPVYVRLIRSDDSAALERISGRPRGPVGAQQPIDLPAALAAASADGRRYLMLADFSKTYYVVPR
jgi:hypothetical protein